MSRTVWAVAAAAEGFKVLTDIGPAGEAPVGGTAPAAISAVSAVMTGQAPRLGGLRMG
jgi:hypothetical protein